MKRKKLKIAIKVRECKNCNHPYRIIKRKKGIIITCPNCGREIINNKVIYEGAKQNESHRL